MTMTFGEALDALKNGYRVVRRSWQLYDPGSFICRQKGYPTGIPINEHTAEATGREEGTTMRFRPYLMVVLTDGTIRERGTHKELVARNGLYAKLYAAQMDQAV